MQNRQLRIISLISGLMLSVLLSGCVRAVVVLAGDVIVDGWRDVKIRGLEPRTSDPSLAISATGVPFMLYWDATNNHKLSVTKFEKGAWIPVGEQAFSSASLYAVSLALDAEGMPYVAYDERSNKDDRKLWVMKLEGKGWTPVGSPVILKKEGLIYTSLALNAAGVPHVAYTEFDSNERKLLVVKIEGSAWVPVGPPIYALRGLSFPSLAFNAIGIPYLAYWDLDNGGKLSVVKLERNTWVPVGPLGFSTKTDGYPSLVLDAAGIPYVAFQGDDSRLSVMKYKGGTWVFVGSPDASPKSAYFPSMMLDAAGVPHVAYLNYGYSGFKFWMTKFEGGAWIPVKPPDFSPEEAGSPLSVQKK